MPTLCKLMAITTVATELTAPLALLSRRLKNFLVVELALTQIGIFVLMYIGFYSWAALYLCWLFFRTYKNAQSTRPLMG